MNFCVTEIVFYMNLSVFSAKIFAYRDWRRGFIYFLAFIITINETTALYSKLPRSFIAVYHIFARILVKVQKFLLFLKENLNSIDDFDIF